MSRDQVFQAKLNYAENIASLRLAAGQAFSEHGASVAKSLILVNSGGVVAILALIASNFDSPHIKGILYHLITSCITLAAGIISAILLYYFMYKNYKLHFEYFGSAEQLFNFLVTDDAKWPVNDQSINEIDRTYRLAHVAGFLSGALFLFSIAVVAWSFSYKV
jgi:hypothetical protein